MAGIPTELQDASKWLMAWSDTAVAEPQPEPFQEQFKPIRAFECPITLTSRYLVIKTISLIPEGRRWKFAGNLKVYQNYPVGTIAGSKTEIGRYPIFLNANKIVQIPDIAPQYTIELSDAYWLRNLYLEVYEYTGAFNSGNDELLESVSDDLTEIKSVLLGE
ncbi:hypothetical protein NIES4074_24010 [Cylindrospermum sp. NIES-4074]|nr:hypothetical protein NIES4074_24010 [Cylindrospermum sp. NIES-4074]